MNRIALGAVVTVVGILALTVVVVSSRAVRHFQTEHARRSQSEAALRYASIVLADRSVREELRPETGNVVMAGEGDVRFTRRIEGRTTVVDGWDQPVRYSLLQKEVLIYSCGANCVDDGGWGDDIRIVAKRHYVSSPETNRPK
jgi:hypothetical protein